MGDNLKKLTHEYQGIPEFDRAIRHIATVPKEVVDQRIAEEKAQRDQQRKEKPQS